MARFVRNELVCAHPALSGVHRELWQGSTYADESLSTQFDFSYEMVLFLVNLSRGNVDWKSDSARRCLMVASRKGCYKPTILHHLGFPNEEAGIGDRAILDAKIIHARMLIWLRDIHQKPLPRVEQVSTMDEIIPFGNLSIYGLRMLQLLWEMAPADRRAKKYSGMPPVQYNWNLEKVTVDDETYALLASIRNNLHTRNAVEALVKFGLVDLVTLPKLETNRGKGRAPVGFHITDAGVRFFADYLENFDLGTKYRKLEEPPAWFGKSEEEASDEPVQAHESEMSDLVDGENLRDLFG